MYLSKLLAVLATTAMALVTLPSSAAGGSPDTALAAYQRNDYETAYRLALPAAQAGDANAQYLLGTQLWRGRGVVRNDVEAAQWFARAAEQNHSDAMTDLAALYQSGENQYSF